MATPPLTERPMRADARRNRERVLDAAAHCFSADGLQAQMDEIAGRAKVGVGTTASDGTRFLKLVPVDRPVTVADLLRHTSGITYDYIGGKLIDKAYVDSGLFDGQYDNKVFSERIAKLPLARQPGTLWRYGHSTDVIGRIIEIVSGQTLYQFKKQHIFDPLGMTSTKFVLESADEFARMAEPLPGDIILKRAEAERRGENMGVRIASLLPSATEILFAIGAGEDVVGVTHECDHPAPAQRLPRLTSSAIDHNGQACAAIDCHIRSALHAGSSIYRLDEELLARLDPDLIVTQELCQVCAVAYAEVERAARRLLGKVPVLSLEPTSLEDIAVTVEVVGRAAGRDAEAAEVAAR